VKIGNDNLVHPFDIKGKPQGLSINSDPKDYYVQRYGGAFHVEALPTGLQVLQSGKVGHFVIAPTTPMSIEKYQQLLNQVQLGSCNSIP
jgi:hypothetical protein